MSVEDTQSAVTVKDAAVIAVNVTVALEGLFKVLLKLNVPDPVKVVLVVVTPFHNTEIVIEPEEIL
jgi:hypothetical protein